MINADVKARIKAREVTAAAFLNKHGEYAKREEDVAFIDLAFADGATTVLTWEQFGELLSEDQTHIKESGAYGQRVQPSPSP